MLSLKRLGYILFIVLSLCTVFFIYAVNENQNQLLSVSNVQVEEEPLVEGEAVVEKGNVTFLVVGDEDKALYQDIYANVCGLMEDMKVSWRKAEHLEDEDLDTSQNVLIFCDDEIGAYVKLDDCMRFLENGGRMILAAGFAEGYADSYMTPAFGIVEKSAKENYNDFLFEEDFLPLQEEELSYNGYTVSTWIKVREDAIVYVSDRQKQVPVIYKYSYGEGSSLIFNTTILGDKQCAGLLAAGIAALLEDFIYPVMGTECVFLDNFPAVTYVDDSKCMKLYGRTTESFVKDVIWPVFQEMAVENGIRYTSSVMTVASSADAFSAKSEGLFFAMQKSALQFDGEMAYGINCEEPAELVVDDDFIDRFHEAFSNYKISSMVMMSEEPVAEAVALFGDDITAVRGKLEAKAATGRLCYTKDYFVFPEATCGLDLEDGNMLAIASVLAGYGMISHTFDVNELICNAAQDSNWDDNKIALADFDERVFDEVSYLEACTLSQTRNRVNSYLNLEYTWTQNGDATELLVNRYADGQAFYVKSSRAIARAEGADFTEVGNGYYLLRIHDSRVTIFYEGE